MGGSAVKETTKDRQKKMEEKQKERLRKAREEKERINEMLGRGIPKAKPLTAAQIADQEFKK